VGRGLQSHQLLKHLQFVHQAAEHPNLNGGGYEAYARDLVSAYLDVKAGNAGSFVLEDDVKKMWGLVFGNVPYAPGGMNWQVSDVRAWLDVMVGNAAL
jgi:hypothetical protein